MIRQAVLRSSVTNFAARAVGIVTALFITPFLIRSLGEGTYGLWILVGSFIGYFGLSDFGLRSAVGRFLALHRAKDEINQMNGVTVTALGLLGATGLVVLAATAASSLFFARAFNLGAAQMATARELVLVVGLTFALCLPLDVFDAILVGHQRYDWINLVEIAGTLARALAVVVMVSLGFGVLGVAWANLAVQLGQGAAKVVLARRVFPEFRLRGARWNRSVTKELYGFGVWAFAIFVSSQLVFNTDYIIVGWALGTKSVAVYSIAARLVQYALAGAAGFSLALMPIAAGMHAGTDAAGQRRLLFEGTKASLLYGFFVACLFPILGRSIIGLWVGPSFDYSASILLVLTLPMVGLIAQNPIREILFGMGRLKRVALIYALDALANVALSLVLVRQLGMIGVAYGTFVTMSVTSFVVMPAYVCHVLRISLTEYWRMTYLPVLAAGLLLAAGLVWLKSVWLPGQLVSLAIVLMTVAAAYFGAVYYFYFAPERRPATLTSEPTT